MSDLTKLAKRAQEAGVELLMESIPPCALLPETVLGRLA
jgi:hypothetical protein